MVKRINTKEELPTFKKGDIVTYSNEYLNGRHTKFYPKYPNRKFVVQSIRKDGCVRIKPCDGKNYSMVFHPTFLRLATEEEIVLINSHVAEAQIKEPMKSKGWMSRVITKIKNNKYVYKIFN